MPSKKKKLSLSDLGAVLGDQMPPGDDSLSDLPVEVLDRLRSPLQVLITESFRKDNKGNELADQVLSATVKAEKESCKQLYEQLCDRTALLADEVITVRFPWRLRVGGTRGFRELILPVFHPIYGIPYVPSSSLKGFLRSWVRRAEQESLNRLLGFIDRDEAALAAVQILDAFPTAPCLKLDMANPQWTWQGDQVKYGTVPHPLLSMAEVTLKIGITRTSLGTTADVQLVKTWLEQAFQAEGLGARASAGYGQAGRIEGKNLSNFSSLTHPYSSEHPFEFWSQGVYGPNPNQPEFRTVAVRGVLRYWFRAVALGLYSPEVCRSLEQRIFGGIEPQAQEGSFKLIARMGNDEDPGDSIAKPHSGTGTLILQTKEENHLVLLQALLKLAFHIGGVGRGARRPLHWNSGRMRGCFWQSTAAESVLPYDSQAWQSFFQALLTAFDQIQSTNIAPLTTSQSTTTSTTTANQPRLQRPRPRRPTQSEGRTQDILDKNARIFLVRSSKLKHPRHVEKWRDEGDKYRVRGAALEFFYRSGFKGVNQNDQGNRHVGGDLGTPSFVWIQSNGLDKPDEAYQVITLFGVDDPEREKFLAAIQDPGQVKQKQEITLPWS